MEDIKEQPCLCFPSQKAKAKKGICDNERLGMISEAGSRLRALYIWQKRQNLMHTQKKSDHMGT